MSTTDPKIESLEQYGNDEAFNPNQMVPESERDMGDMHIEELDDDFVDEEEKIGIKEEVELEKGGYVSTEDEGFGLGDEEPDGTGEYDSEDEWN